MGADAIKLLIYYHPEAVLPRPARKALIEQVIADCHSEDILLFLEIVTYSSISRSGKNPPRNLQSAYRTCSQNRQSPGFSDRMFSSLNFRSTFRQEPDETAVGSLAKLFHRLLPGPWALLSAAG